MSNRPSSLSVDDGPDSLNTSSCTAVNTAVCSAYPLRWLAPCVRRGSARRLAVMGYALAILVILLVAGCNRSSSDDDETSGETDFTPPRELVSQRVQPADTGTGIDTEDRTADFHYVVQSREPSRLRNILLVFLGGSATSTDDYTDISRFAARLGYGVITLRYPNDDVVGRVCSGDDVCFSQFRGESLFGQGTSYAPGQPSYNSAELDTDTANSIVNRLVGVLDFLASQPQSAANPAPDGYWAQFLRSDDQSPYVGMTTGNAYPEWGRIIVAGHSQGAGTAAFLPLHLPEGASVRRIVMFSGPNDHVGQRSADWVSERSATPLDRFWGLRNADEGLLGNFIARNWQKLGGTGRGGVGGRSDRNIRIGAGKGDPRGSPRLVITEPHSTILRNHDSTALDKAHTDAVHPAWRYLLTGNGAD